MLKTNRIYTKAEMTEMFHSRTNSQLINKLKRYGVDFEVNGEGKKTTYKINSIAFPFKIFCITELGIHANTNFYKLRDYYYYYFNDEIFMAMPYEVKAIMLEDRNAYACRQTISNYDRHLQRNEFICPIASRFVYYFAYKHTQRFVEKEEYSKAWSEYWNNKRNGKNTMSAISIMRRDYGGVARKQGIPEINGIYKDKIEYMLDLIQESFEYQLENEIESNN